MEAAGLVYEGNARVSLTVSSHIIYLNGRCYLILRLQGGARAWTAKESPRIIGGTVDQLIQRLTYHRVIGNDRINILV